MSNLPPPPPPGAPQGQPQPPAPGVVPQPPAPGFGAAPPPAPGFGAPPSPPPAFGGPTAVAPTGLATSPVGIGVWISLAVAAICSFLPWATLEGLGQSITKNGTEGDGVITLVLAAIAAGLFFGYTKNGRKGLAIGSVIAAALLALVYVIDFADVSGQFDGPAVFEVKTGFGLILGTIAAIAALVLVIVSLVKAKK